MSAMSLAAIPTTPTSSSRSWWSGRPKSSDARDQTRARSKTVTESSPSTLTHSTSTSRFNAIASAIGFKPKQQRQDLPSVATIPAAIRNRHQEPSIRQTETSFSPDELSSEGPLTPTDSRSAAVYDPFAHESQPYLPVLSRPPPGSTYTLKLQKPLPRPRALTEVRPSTSPRTSKFSGTAMSPRSPGGSTRSSTISASIETMTLTSEVGISRQNTTASSILSRKGSVFSHTEDDSFNRNVARHMHDRLPLPKAPPERILPPTPIDTVPANGSMKFPTAKKPSDPPPSMTKLPATSTAEAVGAQRHSSSTVVSTSETQVHKTTHSQKHQKSHAQQSNQPSEQQEVRSMKESSSKERRRVTSDASVRSTSSQEGMKVLKKQRSFHNIIPPTSFLPSLRHTNSFTPPIALNDEDAISAPPSHQQRPSSQQDQPQRPSSQKGRRRLFHSGSKHAEISDKSSSTGVTQSADRPHDDDSRSVFSLPSDLSSNRESDWAFKQSQSPSKGMTTRPSTAQTEPHILPPEELMRLMETPASHTRSSTAPSETTEKSGRRPSKSSVNTDLPTRSKSLQASNTSHKAPVLPRGAITPTEDGQGFTALCPRPRKPIGTIRRRRPSVSRSESRSTTPQGTTRTMEPSELQRSVSKSTSKSTLRDADVSRNRLTRTASFLTLDDDDNIQKAQASVQPKLQPPSAAGWESDATEEENSFFDFGRGMNSMDSTTEDIFD